MCAGSFRVHAWNFIMPKTWCARLCTCLCCVKTRVYCIATGALCLARCICNCVHRAVCACMSCAVSTCFTGRVGAGCGCRGRPCVCFVPLSRVAFFTAVMLNTVSCTSSTSFKCWWTCRGVSFAFWNTVITMLDVTVVTSKVTSQFIKTMWQSIFHVRTINNTVGRSFSRQNLKFVVEAGMTTICG